jgi:SulP family sulfate permease
MTALAALLVMTGLSLINQHRIATVWQTGMVSRVVMIITFVATLFLAIQVAVAVGVLLHVFVYIYREADKVRIKRLVLSADGQVSEEATPQALPSNEVTVLEPVGSLFFAGAAEFEEHLPDPTNAKNATVILRLRDLDELGSTFIRVIERYAQKVKDTDNRLMLAGVNENSLDQLKDTGVLDVIGQDNVFKTQQVYGASVREALLAAGAVQAFPAQGRLQTVEANLQQAVTLLSGEANESQGERKVRLERDRDGLTPIVQDINSLNEAEAQAQIGDNAVKADQVEKD